MSPKGLVECEFPFLHSVDDNGNIISTCSQTYAHAIGTDYLLLRTTFAFIGTVLFCFALIQTIRIWLSRKNGFSFTDFQLVLHLRLLCLFTVQLIVFLDPLHYDTIVPLKVALLFGNLSAFFVYGIAIEVVFKWIETVLELQGFFHVFTQRNMKILKSTVELFLLLAIISVWASFAFFNIEYYVYTFSLKSILLIYSFVLFGLNGWYGLDVYMQSKASAQHVRSDPTREKRTRVLMWLLLSTSMVAFLATLYIGVDMFHSLTVQHGVRAGDVKPMYEEEFTRAITYCVMEILTLIGGLLLLFFFSKFRVEEGSRAQKIIASLKSSKIRHETSNAEFERSNPTQTDPLLFTSNTEPV